MTELAWYAFSAGGAIVAFGIGLLAVWLRPQSRGARRLLALTGIFYWMASTWSVSHLALAALGAGFQPLQAADVPHGRTAVVVMGSGSFTARDWNDGVFSVVDRAAAARVLEAARVFRLVDPEWVISSGGLVYPDDPHEPSAVTMRQGLLSLGLPPDRVVSETRPRNTATEAATMATLLEEFGIEHTVLVTSRSHMRRSVGAFRARGVTVIPAVAREPDPPRGWIARWLPSDDGLNASALAAHEILGLAYYVVRGWYRFP